MNSKLAEISRHVAIVYQRYNLRGDLADGMRMLCSLIPCRAGELPEWMVSQLEALRIVFVESDREYYAKILAQEIRPHRDFLNRKQGESNDVR